MKPFITYLTSVIRAVTCGLVYLMWFNSSLKPEALAIGNAAARPLSYYVVLPFSSCILLMLTMTFFHHIMTVPLNWTAGRFPKWVSRDFNPRKRWYWPAWDSWREGINTAIVCLIGIVLCSFAWVTSVVNQFEMLSGSDKLGFVLGALILFNSELASAFANLLGDSGGEIQKAREMLVPVLTSDFQKLRIIWLIIATLLYQYLNHDRSSEAAPKSKAKAKKNTQAEVVEINPIEQELNQLSADMGTIKMKSVRKPTKPKP